MSESFSPLRSVPGLVNLSGMKTDAAVGFQWLRNGSEAFAAMLEAIAQARATA